MTIPVEGQERPFKDIVNTEEKGINPVVNMAENMPVPDFENMLAGFKRLQVFDMQQDMEKVMVFGDWHVTDKVSKRHVDYKSNCIKRLQECYQMVLDHKPKIVIFVGDLVGIEAHDKNVMTLEFQAFLTIILNKIKEAVNGELYLIWGNHDEGASMTDAQFFVLTGLFKRAEYIDLGVSRIHLVDYGDEKKKLPIKEEGYNVVVAHNEFFIGRETRWFFNSSKGMELADMTQWKGVDLVLSGHIHLPSPKLLTTSIGDHKVSLFYLGCQTQPNTSDTYTSVFPVILEITEHDVNLDIIEWVLGNDVFKKSNKEQEVLDIISTLDRLGNETQLPTHSREELSEALKELTDFGLLGEHDFISSLKILGTMDKEALDLALATIENIESQNKGVMSQRW